MKLDLNPEKNRSQFEKLRKYSASNMLMLKPGFYYFFGACFILGGLIAIFTSEGTFIIQDFNLTQREYGVLCLAAGLLIVGICKVVLILNVKLVQYRPRENRGDEWHK